jgi:hypothetical protein
MVAINEGQGVMGIGVLMLAWNVGHEPSWVPLDSTSLVPSTYPKSRQPPSIYDVLSPGTNPNSNRGHW